MLWYVLVSIHCQGWILIRFSIFEKSLKCIFLFLTVVFIFFLKVLIFFTFLIVILFMILTMLVVISANTQPKVVNCNHPIS